MLLCTGIVTCQMTGVTVEHFRPVKINVGLTADKKLKKSTH